MKKICVIEDDLGISTSLKLYLENSDFEVALYHSGAGAVEFILSEKPALIILDVNLPEQSGVEVCQKLRMTSQIPIIMLTARNSENDRVSGLEAGADDYISKPFSPRELLARIATILRRSSDELPQNTQILNYENVKIDREKMQVFVDESEIALTKNEYDILEKIWGAQ